MKYLASFYFLFLSFQCFCQTCIIAKKTKNAIYVGAESRVVRSYREFGIYKKDTSVMCKVYTEGIYNFATSGNGINESPKYIREACKQGGSFEKVILRYSDAFREWINSDMIRLAKEMGLDSFAALVKKCQPYYSNAIFWGLDGDSLFLAMATFTVELDKLWNLTVHSSLMKGDVLPASHYDVIGKKLGKDETWNGDIPKIIESLIKEEIKANIFEVGGQIHLLKFTKKERLQWLGGKKPPCK